MTWWTYIVLALHLAVSVGLASGEVTRSTSPTCPEGVVANASSSVPSLARGQSVSDLIEAATHMSHRNGEDALFERVDAVKAKFRDVAEVHVGGESTILSGRDPVTGKKTIIKLGNRNRFAAIDAEVTRYLRERFVALHPGAPVPFLDARYSVEDQAMLMEPARCNLEYWIEKGPHPFEERVRVIREMYAAIRFANDQDVVHHDIKPRNILMMADNRIVVGDFGFASELGKFRHGEDGKFTRGTLAYMSEGHAAGRKRSRKVDSHAARLTAIETMLERGLYDAGEWTADRDHPEAKQTSPVWIASPHTLKADVAPAISAALYFPSRNMPELSFLFELALEYTKRGESDGFFLEVLSPRVERLAEIDATIAANMLLTSNELIDAYRRGLLHIDPAQNAMLVKSALDIYDYWDLPEQNADITIVPRVGTPLRPVNPGFRAHLVAPLGTNPSTNPSATPRVNLLDPRSWARWLWG